jgi:3-hydroxyisobutyrate dehydrogenase-like beta-hydroxyacid dehydrogenase
MGLPMARNIARKGFALGVHNRTSAKSLALQTELAAEGHSIELFPTPRELAARSDVVVSCVPNAPEVESIHLGDMGSREGSAPGTVIVDCSTIAPEAARSIASRLHAHGVDFIDAPVSGGQKGAIEGTLTFFVGGSDQALERARPVLEAMGKRITRLGGSGFGQLGKATNQVIVALNLLAISEGLAFAMKAGLPLDALHPALTGGAANSWALEVLGKKMLERDFKPAFAIRHQQKDLGIVLEAARQQGSPLMGVALVHQLLGALEARGESELGTQALLLLYERLSSVSNN